MKAAPHPQQALRLETLRKYEILDTPRETDFDEIVELASKICNVPISVVNLIDEDRQWFKAEVGIGARETPLVTSICSHVVLSSDFVEINDTHKDPRTADNELCMPADGLRFYAGALLKAKNGMPIGTLCVLDKSCQKNHISGRKRTQRGETLVKSPALRVRITTRPTRKYPHLTGHGWKTYSQKLVGAPISPSKITGLPNLSMAIPNTPAAITHRQDCHTDSMPPLIFFVEVCFAAIFE